MSQTTAQLISGTSAQSPTFGVTTVTSLNGGTITGTSVRGGITSGTAVASTSGTSIDFTSIPSYVKRITVMLNGVSTNGTSNFQLQLGSTTLTTSGYASEADQAGTGINASTGFILTRSITAATLFSGLAQICTVGSNIWVMSGTLGQTNNSSGSFFGGSLSLGATLDRIRITTVNGTDTFDAGSINILMEG
jgi:hypothetical protein